MKLSKILFEGDDVDGFWYHTTSPENVESIMANGLKINSAKGKSRGSLDWMKEAYGGVIPIFLSKESGRYHNGVILKVDVSGLPLVADMPGLVDFGGHVTEHSIYFDEEETPEEFWDLADPETGESINGELEFDVLREPNNPITDAAIAVVGTCAVMEDISPDRIKVIGKV
jgi:hypothetical protein